MLKFDMSDLGKIRYFLGAEVIGNSNENFVCQRNYAREILTRFGMDKSNSMQNPLVPYTELTKDGVGTKVDETLFKQVVGSLMYLIATTLSQIRNEYSDSM